MASDAGSDHENHNEMVMDDDDHFSEQQQSDAEMEEADAEAVDQILKDKVKIEGGANDQTAMTFCLTDEDHTFGNSLRYMVNKNPQVDFCGYSIPHPSESKMNIRIQTSSKTTAVEAFRKGMVDLTEMTKYIRQAYMAELEKGAYETFDELV